MTRQACVCGVVDCRRHGGGTRWHVRASKPLDYNDPTYLRNRAQLLAPKPFCHWCGIRPATTADHLIGAPNGTHDLSNLVPACARCNRLRGASRGGQVAKAKRERAAQEPPGAQR
jgi:5-methylcytosine-specific restriction endonuclease McrA